MMIYLNQKFQSLRLVDALVGLNLCPLNGEFAPLLLKLHFYFEVFHLQIQLDQRLANYQLTHHIQIGKVDDFRRSEERRVGKECRSGLALFHEVEKVRVAGARRWWV